MSENFQASFLKPGDYQFAADHEVPSNPLFKEVLASERHGRLKLHLAEQPLQSQYQYNTEFQIVDTHPTFPQQQLASGYIVAPEAVGQLPPAPGVERIPSQASNLQPLEQFPAPKVADNAAVNKPDVVAGHELMTNKDGALVIKNPDGTIWVRSLKPNDPRDLQTSNNAEHPTWTFREFRLGVHKANEQISNPDGVPANFIETGYFKGSVSKVEGDKLSVSQVYPVPQKWLYSSDGSYVHKFRHGVTEEVNATGIKVTYENGQSRLISPQHFDSYTTRNGGLNVDADYNFVKTPTISGREVAPVTSQIQPGAGQEVAPAAPQIQPSAGREVAPVPSQIQPVSGKEVAPLQGQEVVAPPQSTGTIEDLPSKPSTRA